MALSRDEADLGALVERSSGLQPWRRVFHAGCGISIAAALLVLRPSRDLALLLLGIVVALQLVVDFSRLAVPRLNILFFRALGGLVTPREKDRIASSTWYLIGVLLAVAFFPRAAAVGGILVLALADPAANVVGRLWGRTPFGRNGTVEGSVAFLLIAFAALLLLTGPLVAALAALAAFAAERLIHAVDDNVIIPLAAAAALWGLGVL